ncbi:MAG: aconitate hydratase [Nitrospirota bacterium]|jgi:aconitate hydratase
MGHNIVQKIFEAHRAYGDTRAGSPMGLKVDHVYTQDATGTMAWLQFEAIGVPEVKVPLAVSYVDHNMLQSDFMNADDHAFLESAAAKFGASFSRPGNGISHQVHLERFSAPGKVALGTDSHTPTGGGIGMIAIGVGGLDAATVMAGAPFELKMPEVVLVRLEGKLRRPWVTSMDVILELLRRLTVKGGVGRIMEYGGPGVDDLTVTERATITNMGAELGATTSIFPSDEKTLHYLKAQGRERDWTELVADADAEYSETVELDLSKIEPLTARPHSPDNVVPVRELAGTKINQACIGSCTNSSYQTMRQVASVLKGRCVAPGVSLLVNPGSKNVYEMLSRDGYAAEMVAAGARMLESSCGPCIGMGGTPGTGHVSVRSYNRNFLGRSGNKNAQVYLMNPLLCALFAVRGEFVDPMETDVTVEEFGEPDTYLTNDNMLVPPPKDRSGVEIVKGPNIKEVSIKAPPGRDIEAPVLLALGDNITTDDIMPAGSKILPLRSNIPAISDYVFHGVDPEFSSRARAATGGFIVVGGENYGQGSSREHAAIAPMHLGLQAVIAKSFARIHRSNLINFGVLPLVFRDKADLDRIGQGDRLRIKDLRGCLQGGSCAVDNLTKGYAFEVESNLNEREAELVEKGGLLAHMRSKGA